MECDVVVTRRQHNSDGRNSTDRPLAFTESDCACILDNPRLFRASFIFTREAARDSECFSSSNLDKMVASACIEFFFTKQITRQNKADTKGRTI